MTLYWQGPGWYTIIETEQTVRPHKFAFSFTGPMSLVADGSNSHFRFDRKPGPHEARKYWDGQGIVAPKPV